MIVASAIRYKGIVFTGVRHCEIIRDINRLIDKPEKSLYHQGFIDHMSRFWDRKESKEIVLKCGQKYTPISKTLTSEELW